MRVCGECAENHTEFSPPPVNLQHREMLCWRPAYLMTMGTTDSSFMVTLVSRSKLDERGTGRQARRTCSYNHDALRDGVRDGAALRHEDGILDRVVLAIVEVGVRVVPFIRAGSFRATALLRQQCGLGATMACVEVLISAARCQQVCCDNGAGRALTSSWSRPSPPQPRA